MYRMNRISEFMTIILHTYIHILNNTFINSCQLKINTRFNGSQIGRERKSWDTLHSSLIVIL